MKKLEFFAGQDMMVNIITFVVFIFGLMSVVSIREEVFPNVNFDVITVVTPYPGASADSVERLISSPLELDLKEVDGIKKMESISKEGSSAIIIQLDPDQTTADEAKTDIKDVVDAFGDFPEDAEETIVTVLESKKTPVIQVVLEGNVSEDELRKSAKFFERELELLGPVASVDFKGLRDYEIKVEADPKKLKKYQVNMGDLINSLDMGNINIPGGTVEATEANNYKEVIVRTLGEYDSKEDIENTVLRANVFAEPIFVKDVATVSRGFERKTTAFRVNNNPAIVLTVLKKEKGDAITLVDLVKARVTKLKEKINKDINVAYVNDASKYVRNRIEVLTNNLLFGLLLVLVVLAFVLPVRVAAITAFGIPFSFLGALGYFYLADVSINLISMIGLIIVVGMLVDDAVVVTENTQRLREEGFSPKEAAIKGTQQVWAPVTVSVLTTVMAFAPMLFMSGIFGKFIANIPIGVIAALMISLFECFFILPHHLGAWVKDTSKQRSEDGGNMEGVFAKYWEGYIAPAYSFFIYRVLKYRYVSLSLIFAFCAGSGWFAKENLDFVLFPAGGVEQFYVNFETESGTALEKTIQVSKPIEMAVDQIDKSLLEDFVMSYGEQKKSPEDPNVKTGSEFGQATVYLTAATLRTKSAKEIIEELRVKLGEVEGIKKLSFVQASGGPPVGKPVNVSVSGDDYTEIYKIVKIVEEKLQTIKGVSDIDDTYVLGKEEILVRINRAEAAAAGLNLVNIGTAIRAAYEGIVATSIKKLDEEIDIRVTFDAKTRSSAAAISNLEVLNNTGKLIPISKVTTLEHDRKLSSLRHEKYRVINVLADVDTAIISSTEANNL